MHIGTASLDLRKRERIKRMICLYEWCSMSEHANSVQIRAFIKFLAVLKRRALVPRFNSEQSTFAALGMWLYFILFCVLYTFKYIIFRLGIIFRPIVYLDDLSDNILVNSLFEEFKSNDYEVIYFGFYYLWFWDVMYWEIMIWCYFYLEDMEQTLNLRARKVK